MNKPTFTKPEQTKQRAQFIQDCRQKAWGAACHADWIGKEIDVLMAEYKKFSEEDAKLAAEITALETAIDYHTVENRQKRKGLQERRNGIAQQQQHIGANANQAQKAMQQLYASVESSLALAAHAEGWSWKEHSNDQVLDD